MGMNVGDNVLVTFVGKLFNQTTMTTYGYVLESVTGSPNRNTFLGDLYDMIIDDGRLQKTFEACVPQNWVGSAIWLQVIRPTRFQKRVMPWPDFPSQWPVDAQVPNLAAVIERRGEIANRKNISSLHLPCAGDPTACVGGVITAALLAKMQDHADQVRSTLTPGSYDAIVVPSILNGPLFGDVTPITSSFPQTTSRVMRRRTVGVGK